MIAVLRLNWEKFIRPVARFIPPIIIVGFKVKGRLCTMPPHQDDLIANFRLASVSEPLARCLKALETIRIH
jgi:hypothetical protein